MKYIDWAISAGKFCFEIVESRAVALALSRRSVTADTPVGLQASSCGIYGRQSGNVTGFCLNT
jgi:hypothetical protein